MLMIYKKIGGVFGPVLAQFRSKLGEFAKIEKLADLLLKHFRGR